MMIGAVSAAAETTNPRRDKIRQIVETAGTDEIPAASRWAHDRLRAGVDALAGQRLPQPHDQVLDLQVDRSRDGGGPSRPRLERGRPFR